MRFRIDALRVDSTVIGGVVNQSFSPGMQVAMAMVDGGISTNFVAVSREAPSMSITTHDIAAALAATGPTNARGAVNMWALRQADSGARDGGTVHTNFRLPTACVYPGALSCSDGEAGASLTLNVMGYGTANFVEEVREGQAAPTASPFNQVLYTLGPVVIGANTLVGVQSTNVDFGVTATPDYGDGRIGPKDVVIESRAPSATIVANTLEIAKVMGVLSTGVYGGPLCTTIAMYFRRRTCSGYSESSDNVLVQGTGIVTATSFEGNPMTAAILFTPRSVDGAAPFTINTAAALP